MADLALNKQQPDRDQGVGPLAGSISPAGTHRSAFLDEARREQAASNPESNVINGYYFVEKGRGTFAAYRAMRQMGFLKNNSWSQVQPILEKYLREEQGLDPDNLKPGDAINIVGFLRQVGTVIDPLPPHTLEAGKGLWSVAFPLCDRGLAPEYTVSELVDRLRDFIKESDPHVNPNNLPVGYQINLNVFLRWLDQSSAEKTKAITVLPEHKPSADEREIAQAVSPGNAAHIDPDRPYHIQKGDGYWRIARGIQRAGYLTSEKLLDLQQALRKFNGNRPLRVGESIDIPGFLASTGVTRHLSRKERIRVIGGSNIKQGPDYRQRYYVVRRGDNPTKIVKSYLASIPDNPTSEQQRLLNFTPAEIIDNLTRLRREKLISSRGGKIPPMQPGEKLDLTRIFNPEEIEKTRSLIVNESGSGTHSAFFRERHPRVITQQQLRRLSERVTRNLKKHGIEVDAEILSGLATRESLYNRQTLSVDAHTMSINHARGLTQVRDIAAREVWRRHPWLREKYGEYSSDKLYDPEISLTVGAIYLRQLYDRFGNAADALAAYNQGPTRWESLLTSQPDDRSRGRLALHHKYVLGIIELSPHISKKINRKHRSIKFKRL
ncbi:MAG: lytic transglycosylase domain-containing protein [Candidatus Dadabacteria bacterium]|nr:MAG: lytic transglycosylase domain-containing protein [Candidatus Dadabacteria bacterium]